MGCMQAQDFAAAKWAVGCRLKSCTEAQVESAFNEGRILRTHLLRPTWHLVSPADIRWMLQLSSSKIKSLCKVHHQRLGIDRNMLLRSKVAITRALERHPSMTRQGLALALQKAKINASETRMGFLLMDAELDALICSAGRLGNQFAYGLLDTKVSKKSPFDRDQAMGVLTSRYFKSRGPATMQDFMWWSGLSAVDAKRGIALNSATLVQETIGGKIYWSCPAPQSVKPKKKTVLILPAFDEFTIAYKDRKDVLRPESWGKSGHGLKPIIVHNGQISGTWDVKQIKGKIVTTPAFFDSRDLPATGAITLAFDRYKRFRANHSV
jgi:hypothetical protein